MRAFGLDVINRLFKGDGLKARSIRSTAVASTGFIGSNVLRLAGNLVLTRLLFPEAFGLMALVQVVLAGLQMFSDLGVRTSIIQDERGDDPRFLDTAWTFQIARGIVLWLATVALAGPIANFYDAPMLADLLPVAGLSVLISGFVSTKIANQNRHLRLGKPVLISLAASAIGLVVMIIAAMLTGSVWSLVVGTLVTASINTIASHLLLDGPSNRLHFEKAAFLKMFGFGKYIFLATLAGFLANNADRAILGKFVPLDILAFYNIAFFLANVPASLMQAVNDKVLFPLYRAKSPGSDSNRRADLMRARGLAIAGVLLMAGVAALIGDLAVRILYDPPFEQAGPLMVILAVALMPRIIFGNYSAFALAAGQSGRFAIYVAAVATVNTVAIYLGVTNFGVVGVALAPLAAAVLLYPLTVWLVRPFDAWMPVLDAALFIAAFGFAALALWLNWDALSTGLTTFLP